MPSWPHAPSHEVSHPGAYILTAGTYHKVKHFNSPERLDYLESLVLEELDALGWKVQAWAVFANHYHVVALSPDSGLDLKEIGRRIHESSARVLNEQDGTPGRQVWYRCWDTRLSYSRSYMARLAYVHGNPVKHGLVREARDYRWCSARWFEENARKPFYESIMRFKTEGVKVIDDF